MNYLTIKDTSLRLALTSLFLCPLTLIGEDAPEEFVLPTISEEEEVGQSGSSDSSETEFTLGEETSAWEEDVDGEMYYVLTDFVVTAESDQGYYSAHSLAGSRTNELIKNTPMTISVVNEQLIEDFNLFGVEDIANVVPSVETENATFSNRLLRFRGLLTKFQLYEFMPRQLVQDSYNVDRVDIVRGANSLVYGQAAPGGKANFLSKRAHFGSDFVSIDTTIAENNLWRSSIDANRRINDELSVRVMAVHSEREFDQESKADELDGATLAVTWRPTNRTTFSLHLEGLEQYKNSPPGTYSDATGQYGYTGMLRDLPATPDVIDLLDGSTIDYLLNYNDGFGVAPAIANAANARVPDFFTTKQDLKDFYTKQILIPNREDVADIDPYTVSYVGPSHDGFDPENSGRLSLNEREVDGVFIFADVIHQFTDNLAGKVAVSYEDQQTEVSNRGDPKNVYLNFGNFGGRNVQNADGTGRRAYADGLFISPYWQSSESRDTTIASRSTLSWETEIFDVEQQIIFGFDYDRRASTDEQYNQLAVLPDPVDGSFAGNARTEDFFQLYSGYPNVGVGLNDTGDSNVSGNILTDPNASRIGRPGLGFYRQREREATVEGIAGWIAAQGNYMNGRLNTLVGIRYDHISVEGEIFDVQAGNLQPKEIEETFTEVSPSLGVLFWVTEEFGLFANYARSIESPNGWAFDPQGNSVPTETGEGFEAGVKFDMLDGDLTGQIIGFHITKENEQKSNYSNPVLEIIYPYVGNENLYPDAVDETDTGGIQPLGRNIAGNTVVSQGVELDLYYNPTPELSLFLGYAYVETEYTKTAGGFLDGQTLPGTANHNVNLTGRYTFKEGPLKGWYFGANQKYRSKGLYGTLYEDLDFDGREDVLGIPGQAAKTHEIWLEDHFETAVFLGWRGKLFKGKDSPLWNFQFTVNNVFDQVDLISSGNARYTDGRTAAFKASVKF